jgi:hypothetical protein
MLTNLPSSVSIVTVSSPAPFGVGLPIELNLKKEMDENNVAPQISIFFRDTF